MANRGVKGRIVFAEPGDPPIPNVMVAAFDIDPFNADGPLGKEVLAGSTGEFAIDHDPSTYRLWIVDRKPDIELRVYGPGKRVLWQSEVHEDVDVDVLTFDPIRIHRTNFPTSDPQDSSWLVCHTSLDLSNGTPVRLTTGNEIEWLIDGAKMFPAVTDVIEGAKHFVRFMNVNFYIKGLISKVDLPEYAHDVAAFNRWTLQGAIAKSDLSFARRRKSTLAPDEVNTVQEPFAIVHADSLALFDAQSITGTERAALQRRDTLIASNPALHNTLQIVPIFEMRA